GSSVACLCGFVFFFSSRRRHTRSKRDWSSDVCSSDLVMIAWMNDWRYGQNIPTSPWRSADTFPRKLTLTTVNGTAQLAQQPIPRSEERRVGKEWRPRWAPYP